ncbi:unnamed protein product [Victoria cruziana]
MLGCLPDEMRCVIPSKQSPLAIRKRALVQVKERCYDSPAAAQSAIKMMNGFQLSGKKLKVTKVILLQQGLMHVSYERRNSKRQHQNSQSDISGSLNSLDDDEGQRKKTNIFPNDEKDVLEAQLKQAQLDIEMLDDHKCELEICSLLLSLSIPSDPHHMIQYLRQDNSAACCSVIFWLVVATTLAFLVSFSVHASSFFNL